VLNERRGLLAAVMGNPSFYPGAVDVYDLSEDCRNPILSSTPLGYLGHESGFAPDGRTLYATSIGTGGVTALDVSDPRLPRIVWRGRYASHGLTVSDDGTRAYLADVSASSTTADRRIRPAADRSLAAPASAPVRRRRHRSSRANAASAARTRSR